MKAALDWAIERDDFSTAATAYFYLSRQAEIDRDLELAASLIQSCITLRRQLNDVRGAAKAQIMEAHYHYRRENFSEVRRIVERIEAALAPESNPDISVRVMSVLGNLHWGERNLAEARKYYLRGIELCDKISALRNKAVLLDNLARMFRSLNCPEDVISWQFQARQIFERIGNPVLAARAMMWEGVEWACLGDYYRARSLQMEALHRGEQLNRPDVCCLVITFLCRTERYAGNFEALRHWQSVQRDLPHCDDEAGTRHKAMCLYELGLAEFQQGVLPAAEAALKESIELAPAINSDVIPMLCTNAVLLLQLSRIKEAASNLKLAVDAVDANNWPGTAAQVLDAGACLAAVLNQQTTALELLARAERVRNDETVRCPIADLLERSWAEAALGGLEVQYDRAEFMGSPASYKLVRELLTMAGAE
jgi:tetratricopeptide (TPR) repeat protein